MNGAQSNVLIDGQTFTKVIGYDANGSPVSGGSGSTSVRGIGAAGSVAFTRPANTTAYTALDVIGGASSAIHELNLGVPAGALVQIDTMSLTMNRATVPSGMGTVVCHIYTAAPTAIADNAAFSSAAADFALYAGSITLSTPAVVGGGFIYSRADYAGLKIRLTTSSIFVVPQTTGGYTPASATEHILRARGVDLGA
jgi:hypothetical protein